MNKYLLRGLLMVAVGVGATYYSYGLMVSENDLYKWLMSLGVILFGVGFMTVMYSLFRKIDRRTIQKQRREQHRQNLG